MYVVDTQLAHTGGPAPYGAVVFERGELRPYARQIVELAIRAAATVVPKFLRWLVPTDALVAAALRWFDGRWPDTMAAALIQPAEIQAAP